MQCKVRSQHMGHIHMNLSSFECMCCCSQSSQSVALQQFPLLLRVVPSAFADTSGMLVISDPCCLSVLFRFLAPCCWACSGIAWYLFRNEGIDIHNYLARITSPCGMLWSWHSLEKCKSGCMQWGFAELPWCPLGTSELQESPIAQIDVAHQWWRCSEYDLSFCGNFCQLK